MPAIGTVSAGSNNNKLQAQELNGCSSCSSCNNLSDMVVPEAIRGYQKGQILPGVSLDIRNKLIELDGNMPHAVTKFEGTRFSVVFFTRAEALSKEVYEKLQQHGFPSEIIATKAFLRSPIRGPLLRYEHETRTRLRS